MGTLTPFLMFQGQGEAAMERYLDLFPNSRLVRRESWQEGEPGVTGAFKLAEIALAGQAMIIHDSPITHAFSFTPALSMFFDTKSPAVFEELAIGLSEGGTYLMPPDDYGFSKRFAWVQDQFGVSWQLQLSA